MEPQKDIGDLAGNCGRISCSGLCRRKFLQRSCEGNRLLQEEYSALSEISIWNRLAWKRYVCKDSIIIGVCAATFSAVMAFILGVVSATMGKTADTIVTWFIDLIMGIPHMLLLILICVACGRGLKGVILGVALTHWTSLASASVKRADLYQNCQKAWKE